MSSQRFSSGPSHARSLREGSGAASEVRQRQAPALPDPLEECDDPHLQWIDAFLQENTDPPGEDE